MTEVCDDLAAEKRSLRSVLAALDAGEWYTATPAHPWTIRDQVSHLAFFDEKAVLAVEDAAAFLADLENGKAVDLIDAHLAAGRAMDPAELLAWWDEANARLIAVYWDLDPKARVVWYGPPMAARSKVTARIMETWAHGQDIVDALGIRRPATVRLRHVCHIGVRARPYAYLVNGLTPPTEGMRVALRAPDGSTWEWGDPAAANIVEGSALGFALLVTQRRHRNDVDVVAHGAEAERWLGIAQAFAGPPGEGRTAGQFDHLGAAS